MTELVYRDAYLQTTDARVIGETDDGALLVNRTVFYPTSGGQPGDTGTITWSGGTAEVVNTVKAEDQVALVLAEGAERPQEGDQISQQIDWGRRFGHMRVHTALHLLSVVIPLPVTGGSISTEKGRLDFNMPEAPEDKEEIARALNTLIASDMPVTDDWITDAELEERPELVKTMSVKPPVGQGRVRLVRIGEGDAQLDLQPCGGTHVARTSEIGRVRIGKIEKKGRQNRRVYLHLDE